MHDELPTDDRDLEGVDGEIGIPIRDEVGDDEAEAPSGDTDGRTMVMHNSPRLSPRKAARLAIERLRK